MAAAVVERRSKLLLVRLSDDAPRWAGMWQFPCTELAADENSQRAAERAVRELSCLKVRAGEPMTTIRHSVTRYRIALEVYRCGAAVGRATGGHNAVGWYRPRELSTLALPAAHRKIARLIDGG
jgi:A/G-specific adenine glycosylase